MESGGFGHSNDDSVLSSSVAIKPSGLPLKVSALVVDDTFMTRRKMHFTVLVVTQRSQHFDSLP